MGKRIWWLLTYINRLMAYRVWFAYAPDRKGERHQTHLMKFAGTLQADANAG